MPETDARVTLLGCRSRRWLVLIAVISAVGIAVWVDHRMRVLDRGRLPSSGEETLARLAVRSGTYDPRTKTPVRLGYVKGLSKRFTRAVGRAELNFTSGEIAVTVEGLDALPEGSAYEVWLVEHGPGTASSVGLDLGKGEDRILNLGMLPVDGSRVFSVGSAALASFEVDMITVMRTGGKQAPEITLAGMQSVFFKLGRQATVTQRRGLLEWLFPKLEAAPPNGLIGRGRRLFFEETFKGNGRTCGTCHPADNNLILNPEFIQDLAVSEPFNPLFVSDNFPDDLPPGLFEDPLRMRAFSHILENQDGFDEVCGFPGTDDGDVNTDCIKVMDVVCTAAGCEHPLSKSVRRAIPTIINTDLTEPFGLGGDIADLQAFCLGAVVQHFPKTLNRTAGRPFRDFRLPTVRELEAMEAFMQSVLLPSDVDEGFNPFALATTDAEIRGAALFQAGVTGPAIRGSAGRCLACHFPPTLGAAVNFDTGVNALAFSQALPFDDGGANSGGVCGSDGVRRRFGTCNGGSFNVPPLLGIGVTAPFFHNGAVETLRESVEFYISREFAASSGSNFVAVLTRGSIVLNPQNIDDIVAFLEALVEQDP